MMNKGELTSMARALVARWQPMNDKRIMRECSIEVSAASKRGDGLAAWVATQSALVLFASRQVFGGGVDGHSLATVERLRGMVENNHQVDTAAGNAIIAAMMATPVSVVYTDGGNRGN